jgi:hypothetical protein
LTELNSGWIKVGFALAIGIRAQPSLQLHAKALGAGAVASLPQHGSQAADGIPLHW